MGLTYFEMCKFYKLSRSGCIKITIANFYIASVGFICSLDRSFVNAINALLTFYLHYFYQKLHLFDRTNNPDDAL